MFVGTCWWMQRVCADMLVDVVCLCEHVGRCSVFVLTACWYGQLKIDQFVAHHLPFFGVLKIVGFN